MRKFVTQPDRRSPRRIGNKAKDRRIFSHTADRMAKDNVKAMPKRGGNRL